MGVRIVFSEAEGSADAVIVKLAGRFRERAAVVSSDREVIQLSRSFGAETLTSQEFLGRLAVRSVQRGDVRQASEERDDDEDPPPSAFGKKKGNPRRLSKKERAQRRLLDKL